MDKGCWNYCTRERCGSSLKGCGSSLKGCGTTVHGSAVEAHLCGRFEECLGCVTKLIVIEANFCTNLPPHMYQVSGISLAICFVYFIMDCWACASPGHILTLHFGLCVKGVWSNRHAGGWQTADSCGYVVSASIRIGTVVV